MYIDVYRIMKRVITKSDSLIIVRVCIQIWTIDVWFFKWPGNWHISPTTV